MRTFFPSELPARERHQLIIGSIGPRPIAFVSTIDKQGRPNLAPYSFFNVFSSSPPLLIVSIGRRASDGAEKDSLRNARDTGQLVINLVDYHMVRQMAIAGIEYGQGVSEFEKSGLTPLASHKVKPFRVKESPAQYECHLVEIKTLENLQSPSTLIIAEAVVFHLRDDVFDKNNRIDPQRMDLVGRLGGYSYCRASGESVFSVIQPHAEIALGFDALPESIRNSSLLTGNELAMLAGVTQLPEPDQVEAMYRNPEIQALIGQLPTDPLLRNIRIHGLIREYLQKGKVMDAWSLILSERLLGY